MFQILGPELLEEPIAIRLRLFEGRARPKPRHNGVIPAPIPRVGAQIPAPEVMGGEKRRASREI